MTVARPVSLLLRAAILATVALGAAKPPKPSSIAATVTFRCYSNNDGNACLDFGNNSAADRVRDDSVGSYSGSISSGGILAAAFSSATPGTPRYVTFLLGTAESAPLCIDVGNCNPDDSPAGQQQDVATFDVKLRPQTGSSPPLADLPGGLPAMECGVNYPAHVQYTFWVDGGDGHWGVNFNPNVYPLGTAAIIVRTGTQTWVVSAGTGERAELVSFSHSGIRRKNGPSREGVFVVPFKLTIDATDPVAPGMGCQ